MKHEGFKSYSDRELLELAVLSAHETQTKLHTIEEKIDWQHRCRRKEAADLRAFMGWQKEDANLGRRAHSAHIAHAVFAAALFVAWVLYPVPAWMPNWAHWAGLAVLIWYQVWPHEFLARPNRAVEKHAESEPSWGDIPE
jgi:hypothetical protein